MNLLDPQRARVLLGLDPENAPPYSDEPACEHCGSVLSRGRGLCQMCEALQRVSARRDRDDAR